MENIMSEKISLETAKELKSAMVNSLGNTINRFVDKDSNINDESEYKVGDWICRINIIPTSYNEYYNGHLKQITKIDDDYCYFIDENGDKVGKRKNGIRHATIDDFAAMLNNAPQNVLDDIFKNDIHYEVGDWICRVLGAGEFVSDYRTNHPKRIIRISKGLYYFIDEDGDKACRCKGNIRHANKSDWIKKINNIEWTALERHDGDIKIMVVYPNGLCNTIYLRKEAGVQLCDMMGIPIYYL